MPIFTLITNVPSDKIPSDFVKSTSVLIAEILGKPESYVCIVVQPDHKLMSFGGTTDPCAYVELHSIGKLGAKENKSHSAAIAKHVEAKLGIKSDRFFIKFDDLAGSDTGYGGSTF